MFFIVVILLLVGIFAGFMGGLLGIGGGVIIVPAVFMLLKHFGIGGDEEMLMAVGTSMMVIVFNSLAASYAHYKANAIQFDIVKKWALFIVIGVILGCYLAVHIPEKLLITIYVVYLFLIAIRFLYTANFKKTLPHKIHFSRFVEYLISIIIGLFSALFGTGGGTFSVPFFCSTGLDMKKSVATASFIGFVVSVPAAINYMLAGRDIGYYSGVINIGYISFLCVIAILPTSMYASYFGGKMVHHIPERLTRNIFACLLIIVGIKMLLSDI